MKKIIVSLLTVCMLFSVCSVSVFAEEDDVKRVPVTVTEDSVLTLNYYDDTTGKTGAVDIKAATTLGYYELVLPYGIDLENASFMFYSADKIKFSVSEEHRTLWDVDDALLERYFNNLRINIWENLTYCKGDSTEYTLIGGSNSIKLEDGQTYTISLGSEHSMLPKNDDNEEDYSLGSTKYVALTGSVKFAFKVRVDGPAALKGASHTVTKGESTDLVAEFDEELAKFVKVVYDGKELKKDVDYTATEGSTVITLKDSFVNTLRAGTHNVYAYFEDGTSVISVTVKEKITENNNSSNTSSSSNQTNQSNTNSKSDAISPKTSESATPVVILFSSLVLLIAAAVAYKKIKN